MKTPCLKCGLIHDEPTAICDGYAGVEVPEGVVDSRRKAVERIRAVLAAVPVESRQPGRARAASAGAGLNAAQSPVTLRPISGRAETPPPEVPEWRREVTERLESYRSRRERQRAATNQSVLAFRVHSKTDTLENAPEPEVAPAGTVDASVEAPAAASAAECQSVETAPALESLAAPGATPDVQRVYAPMESSPAESLSEETFAAAVARPAGDSAETTSISAAETHRAPAALPIATEPAVVLADSSILEVHADPPELAEVQPAAPAFESVVTGSAPLATIPAIDTEYWHAQPTPASPESSTETEETECGSLTSGFERHPAIQEETEKAEQVEEVQEVEELAEEDIAPADEAPAFAALAEDAATGETLSDSQETTEEEKLDSRRAALRTAARPLHGTAPERIEISVPQPVFDFSAAGMENEQPQVQGPPVADLRERRRAAILDATILAFTIAGFFLAFHLAGGEFSFSRVGAAVGVAAAFLIYAQYILLFTMVAGSTPGMVLRGLCVVRFDGRRPEGVELAWRGFGYLLSAAAGMLGFLWSAWDEHGLTWHDRISQTYITYAEPEGVPAVLTLQ